MISLRLLKKKARADYKKIGSVYCPVLSETVKFTSSGFDHLTYRGRGRPRNPNEQYMKLKCLVYVPAVVRESTKLKEARKVRAFRYGKWVNVAQYSLVHEVSPGKNMRVVVEKLERGQAHKFVSVMPDDNASRHRPRKTKKRP